MKRANDRAWRWGWTLSVISIGSALLHCGGRVIDDEREPSDNGGAPTANAGTAGDDRCEPIVAAGTCGGGHNLDTYAGLRTACNLDTTVNRSGTPVPICHHIK
ncbi:MAG TPA: hypothetical protein VER96_39870 [Polyangiaceae bacterium]|nr:hypothetical protein [Polyangiaceae bacterium]